jgi:acyl carrier protein
MDVVAVVLDMIKEHTGNSILEADFDVSLQELGFDSLDVIDFIFNIENKFNIKTTLDGDIKTLTINIVIEHLKTKMIV